MERKKKKGAIVRVEDDEEKRGVGRPSNYDPDTMPEKAFRLSMAGFTEEHLGIAFGVSAPTISMWKKKYPEFREALEKGGIIPDSNVAISLYKKATGYSHPDIEIRVIDGEVVKIPIEKHYPPDTTAIIFWLKNRQRDKWRDTWNIDHSGLGKGGALDPKTLLEQFDIKQLSIDELEVVASLGIKVKKAKEITNDGTKDQGEIIDMDEAEAEVES